MTDNNEELKLLTENYIYSLELGRKAAELRTSIHSSVDRMAVLLAAVDRFIDAQDRWSDSRIGKLRDMKIEDAEHGNKEEEQR